MNSPDFVLEDGVLVSAACCAKFKDFEKEYLAVRQKEKKVLSIEQIQALPYPAKGSDDENHWKLRRKNIVRFKNYLNSKRNLQILEIGCGNGFFANLISTHQFVTAVDVNLFELQQAAKAFAKQNIQWYCADIMDEEFLDKKFDLIVFCSSFQYFNDPLRLLTKCKTLLTKAGEIHILDTPLYSPKALVTAKKNSENYFITMGNPAMKNYYHHHGTGFLNGLKWRYMYKPKKFLNKLLGDSPFPWICISI